MLCDICGEHEATVFVTKIVNNTSTRHSLCAGCARRRASSEGWMPPLFADFTGAADDDANDSQDDADAAATLESLFDMPLQELVMGLFHDLAFPGLAEAAGAVEFAADEDETAPWEDDEPFADEPAGEDETADEPFADEDTGALFGDIFATSKTPRTVPAVRCAKCGTTWDRLRQDGRVGCATCYATFAEQLGEVMERVQGAAQHTLTAKRPRAAQKRHHRLEHLRARRDHRLAMLNRRLQEAVDAERYEDAAKLRDKIKIVTSTIVHDETQ